MKNHHVHSERMVVRDSSVKSIWELVLFYIIFTNLPKDYFYLAKVKTEECVQSSYQTEQAETDLQNHRICKINFLNSFVFLIYKSIQYSSLYP